MKALALIAFVASLCSLAPAAQARDIGLSVQIVQPGVSGVIHVGRPLRVATPVWVEPAWVEPAWAPEPWCDEPRRHRHHVHRFHSRDHHRAYHRHHHRHHGQHPRHRHGRD